MRKNRAKHALQQGDRIIGTWLDDLRSPAVAQLLAAAGMDFLIVDMEHGPYTLETMADIVRVARLVDITPIVRIPDLTWEWVGRVLDAGAQGLMLPRGERAAQVAEFVSYAIYPPQGRRSMAAGLGNTDFQWVTTQEYIDFVNNELLLIVQIESKTAVDHVDELISVPGVDVFFIGPEDLSISLGHPGNQSHAAVVNAIGHVLSKLEASPAASGIHVGNTDVLSSLSAQGVQFFAYGSDVEFIYNGAVQGVEALQRHNRGARGTDSGMHAEDHAQASQKEDSANG